jgi:hypothetical protein
MSVDQCYYWSTSFFALSDPPLLVKAMARGHKASLRVYRSIPTIFITVFPDYSERRRATR